MPTIDQFLGDFPEIAKWTGWVTVIAALGIAALRIRRIIQWVQVKWTQLSPNILKKFSSTREFLWHCFGLATANDLGAISTQLEAFAAGRERAKGQQDIARRGMSWRLTDQFWEVAQQNDSLAIHDNEIHKIVQGPFCLHCSARCITNTLYMMEASDYSSTVSAQTKMTAENRVQSDRMKSS